MKPNIYIKDRSGIYGLRNLVNGKIYVGKTKCFYKRCHQYVYDFRERKLGHLNDHLFNAMNKVGIENFEFFVLEFCDQSCLSERELYWMDQLKSCERNRGYNLRRDSSSGMITSDETSQKISSNLKRQWSQGVRDDHSDKMKRAWDSDPSKRVNQSKLMTRILTKYTYCVITPEGEETKVRYKDLVSMGLQSAMSSFARNKSDTVTVKGHTITRKVVE